MHNNSNNIIQASSSEKTLFDKIGKDRLKKVIDLFYNKVLKDKELCIFFKKKNIKQQKRHQTRFLTVAFGGKSRYRGQTLVRAHRRLPLKDKHFTLFTSLLQESLHAVGIEGELVSEAMMRVNRFRPAVLGQIDAKL